MPFQYICLKICYDMYDIYRSQINRRTVCTAIGTGISKWDKLLLLSNSYFSASKWLPKIVCSVNFSWIGLTVLCLFIYIQHNSRIYALLVNVVLEILVKI